MKKTQQILERENTFKGNINTARVSLNQLSSIVYRTTGVKIPNYVDIYRNKIWEFECFFEEHGMFFFDDNCYLRVIIIMYLNVLFLNCGNAMIKYSYKVNMLSIFSVLFKNDRQLKIIYDNIDLIQKIDVNDLPGFLEKALNSNFMFWGFLPDMFVPFVKECLGELEILGFDLNECINIKKLFSDVQNRALESHFLLKMGGVDKRLQAFETFNSFYNLNIDSKYLNTGIRKELH